MATADGILSRLRKQGLRLTPQRTLILSVIAECDGHVDVGDIYRRTKKVYPFMAKATIYRTLSLFNSLGVVTEVRGDDRMHFELVRPGHEHHHMVCVKCRQALDLNPAYLEEFRTRLVTEYGFQPSLENFTVTGVCVQCGSSGDSVRQADARAR